MEISSANVCWEWGEDPVKLIRLTMQDGVDGLIPWHGTIPWGMLSPWETWYLLSFHSFCGMFRDPIFFFDCPDHSLEDIEASERLALLLCPTRMVCLPLPIPAHGYLGQPVTWLWSRSLIKANASVWNWDCPHILEWSFSLLVLWCRCLSQAWKDG